MTITEFKARAKKHFMNKIGADGVKLADQVADGVWDLWIENGADENDTPEECVDEELAYWESEC